LQPSDLRRPTPGHGPAGVNQVEQKENVGFRFHDVSLMQIPAVGECNVGMHPVEYNCIVAPATVPEKTKGGVILGDQTREMIGLAYQIGRLVELSPIAFNYDKWPTGSHPPKVGDVVWYARYAGGLVTGRDGREYRIIKDKDIGGVIEEQNG
jgi:co-chaperonin GroES (HSP10)